MKGAFLIYMLVAGLCIIWLGYKAGLALWPIDRTLAVVAAGCALSFGCRTVVHAIDGLI